MHDWGVSRQRYWGCPIPVIFCKNCGAVPVPEEDLPVTLPTDVELTSGGNPLDKHPTWKFVNCPKCKEQAERETDTFDYLLNLHGILPHFVVKINPSIRMHVIVLCLLIII